MEIKLRARLAAYSKIDSIENNAPKVPNTAIDTLFKDGRFDHVVTKEDIDKILFANMEKDRVVEDAEIDNLFTSTPDSDRKVSFKEIDSLFG